MYLATVIDLYSRQIIGWSMAASMQTQLVSDAMDVAVSRGFIQPGSVFHTDRSAQYTSAGVPSLVHWAPRALAIGGNGVSLLAG